MNADRRTLAETLADHGLDAPAGELSPAPPKTGRNGDSGPAGEAGAAMQVDAAKEFASSPAGQTPADCHHDEADAGAGAPPPAGPSRETPENDTNRCAATAWAGAAGYDLDDPAAPSIPQTLQPANVGAGCQPVPDARISPASNDAPRNAISPQRRNTQKLTESEQDRVLLAVSLGLSLRQAAAMVGCHHTTLVKRAKRDKQFADAIARARLEARGNPLLEIYKASKTSWRAAAWLLNYLDRRDARGRRQEGHTGAA